MAKWVVNGVDYNWRRALYANTAALGPASSLVAPFIGPDLTGEVLASFYDVVLTEADGTTLLGSPGSGKWAGRWDDLTPATPLGSGLFELAGGDAAELVAYLYYGNTAASADLSDYYNGLGPDMHAFHRMDDAADPITDLHGNVYDLTHLIVGNNPLYQQTGLWGYCVGFRSYLQPRMNASDLTTTSRWTLCALVKPISYNTTYPCMMTKNASGGNVMHRLSVNHTNGKLMLGQANSGGATQWLTGNTPMTTGEWHHVAGSWDGADLRVYLDGDLDGTLPLTQMVGGPLAWQVGGYASDIFNGEIDLVAYYSVCQGDDWIKAHAMAALTQDLFTWGDPEAPKSDLTGRIGLERQSGGVVTQPASGTQLDDRTPGVLISRR